MSRILIKFPTRSRLKKSLEVLKKYVYMANNIQNIKIIVSVDEDDNPRQYDSMKFHDCIEVIVGPPSGKIGAINRDIPDPKTFDILLLASDDMIPQIQGYDDIIRQRMFEHFSDTDGVLFFNDGNTKYNLNTLVICGSKYYSRFGYIYNPEYKSLWCDNEFMDEANRLGRQIYFHDIIIKHKHPLTEKGIGTITNTPNDNLYKINQTFFDIDKETYCRRKKYGFHLSILILTIPSRLQMFIDLLNRISKLKQQSLLNVEVLFDDREKISIGEKRNNLIDICSGECCCFIDDDDKITDDYLKVIEDSQLKYDCIKLNGELFLNGIKDKSFIHSLYFKEWSGDEKYLYRNPNHLNPIKSSIVKSIRFKNINVGEDRDFSQRLLDSGLLKTEYNHDKVQYLYMLNTNISKEYKYIDKTQKKILGFFRRK